METPQFISTTAITFLAYHAPRALSMTVRVDSMAIVLSHGGRCVRFMTKGIRALRYTRLLIQANIVRLSQVFASCLVGLRRSLVRDERAGRPSLVRAWTPPCTTWDHQALPLSPRMRPY